MLSQPNKSAFVMEMLKDVEAHEMINHGTLINKIEVDKSH